MTINEAVTTRQAARSDYEALKDKYGK